MSAGGWRRALLAGCWLAMSLASLATSAAAAQSAECSGFRYVEWPERGPLAQTGRPLAAAPGTEYGVDVNSRIQIVVEAGCLNAYVTRLPGAAASVAATGALATRLDSLSAALAAVPDAMEQLRQTFEAYAAAGAAAGATFRERLRISSGTMRRILGALQAAIQARLEAGDSTRASAARDSRAELDVVLSGGGALPYDWDALRALLNREIELARADLDRLRREGYALEIRAHLLSGKGQYPVALAGYNEQAACEATRVEPIELDLSPEQAAVFQHAESLEHSIAAVRAVGNVVVASVAADLDRIRPELDTLLGRARAAAVPVASSSRQLARWAEGDTLRVWTESVRALLARDPRGATVAATLDSLTEAAGQVKADLEALRALGALREQLAGAPAQVAMQLLLARVAQIRQLTDDDAAPIRALQPAAWLGRAELVRRLAARLGELPAPLAERVRSDPRGPIREVEAFGRALRAAADSLQGVSRDGLGLLARVLGLPPALLAANLPEPSGLRRVAVDSAFGTEIELTRICAARHENDVVQVEYRFLSGGQPAGGWTDRFRLRVFGLQSRVSAGLAFAIRQHTDTWRPGAQVSWIFTHRRWPRGANRGLGDPSGMSQIGLGLTAVNLHFESDEAIELGLGPSLAFLGNRLILGGGWNLQAHGNHLYGLLSVRLLDIARGT